VIWERTAGAFFPGLSIRALPMTRSAGSIQSWQFGPGRLWTILSPTLQVHHAPSGDDSCAASGSPVAQTFSVMLQIPGSTIAAQHRRSCRLQPRDICVTDGQLPFALEVDGPFSRFMFLQIPRHMVLGRHPYLAGQTAERFDGDEPGARPAFQRRQIASPFQSSGSSGRP